MECVGGLCVGTRRLLLHITISRAQPHSPPWTGGFLLAGGVAIMCTHDIHNRIQNSSASKPLSPWRQPRCAAHVTPIHPLLGRAKDRLPLLPERGETKGQEEQRWCQEAVLEGTGNDCVFLLRAHAVMCRPPKSKSRSVLPPLRCS